MNSYFGLILVIIELTTLSQAVQVHPSLQAKVNETETFSIMVTFTQLPSTVHATISGTHFPGRTQRIEGLRNGLLQLAERSQANAVKTLVAGSFTYFSIWISNQIFVPSATTKLVKKLSGLESDISSISVNSVFSLNNRVPPLDGSPVHRGSHDQNGGNFNFNATIIQGAWGIRKIGADKVQRLLQRQRRQSHDHSKEHRTLVGSIDTGVHLGHEALRDNYLWEYGWLDPFDGTDLPNDQGGHGTHTMGTICGHGGIGVNPAATWMSCKGCSEDACPDWILLTCAQFILCPTLPDGSSPNCSLAPQVVSNSWGGNQANPFYDWAIAAWQIAGIIPVFAIGNNGPACGTAISPGDRVGVISVGSTMQRDELSRFSCRGPTIDDGRIKPDISAPGDLILSAWNTEDDAYNVISGTSMATPHVTGAISVLLGEDPSLTYDQVRELLSQGADRDLPTYSETCGNLTGSFFPNNYFGWGRLNLWKSFKLLLQQKS